MVERKRAEAKWSSESSASGPCLSAVGRCVGSLVRDCGSERVERVPSELIRRVVC